MKNIKILPLVLALALLLGAPVLADGGTEPAPELLSAAAAIADEDTGRVLYELNGAERRAPASLTKMMTVLLAVEAVERGDAGLDDQVTAGGEAETGMVEDGSMSAIQPGETMTLRDLLYCAMLCSANDACNVIAVYVSGSLDAFVGDMNERAAAIGCEGTHFANAHGLPAEGHYTTAIDCMRILREAMNHALFAEISGAATYTVPATNLSEERQLSNTNGLINPETRAYPGYYYEYARAGKTGHTEEAGYCLASVAERDGARLVCVVLGGVSAENADGSRSYSNFSDSRQLYSWAFSNFSVQEVLSTTELVASVKVELAEDGGQAMLRPEQAVSALLPDTGFDFTALDRDVEIFSESDGEPLRAPIAGGSVLGRVSVSLGGVELGEANLVTGSTVELARTEFMKQEIGSFFGNIWVELILVALVAAVAFYIASVVRYRKLHRRHLESVAAARERAGQEPAAQPAQDAPAPAAPRPAPGRSVRDTDPAMEKTTVISGVKGAARPAGAEPPAPGRAAGAQPPAGSRARRDYFEEFFRSNGNRREAPKGGDGGRDSEKQ